MGNDYLQFFLEYTALPRSERSIFDVTGYPHYENVCSNVLAFYLNPREEHGLGELVLKSLLMSVDNATTGDSEIKEVQIDREYSTKKDGRIDILITTNNYVIGIENKIFAGMKNDLQDYSDTIKDIANTAFLKPICIVLSLKEIPDVQKNGFKNITYKKFCQQVRKNLGKYVTKASSKWLLYFIDFIKTMETLRGGCMELNEREKFLIGSRKVISNLENELGEFRKKLKEEVKKLEDIFGKSNDTPPKHLPKRWIYNSYCLVHDFELSCHQIAFDVNISLDGWVITLFGRNPESKKYVNLLLQSRPDWNTFSSDKFENNRFVVAKWSLDDTNLPAIKETLCEWMNWIVKEDEKYAKLIP